MTTTYHSLTPTTTHLTTTTTGQPRHTRGSSSGDTPSLNTRLHCDHSSHQTNQNIITLYLQHTLDNIEIQIYKLQNNLFPSSSIHFTTHHLRNHPRPRLHHPPRHLRPHLLEGVKNEVKWSQRKYLTFFTHYLQFSIKPFPNTPSPSSSSSSSND